MKRVWALHVTANALLLWLVWIWLGIRDARAWQIAITAVLGLAIVAGALWLHGTTWNWAATREWKLLPLRRLAVFALVLAVFLLISWGLGKLPLDRAAVWIGSLLTIQSRKPVNPAMIGRVLYWLRWFVQWVIVPVLLLPIAGGDRRQSLRPRFWLEYCAVLIAGFLVPGWLLHWAPKFGNTSAEVASFIVRFGVAYGLAIAGWIALAFFSSGGRPPVTQPTTASLP